MIPTTSSEKIGRESAMLCPKSLYFHRKLSILFESRDDQKALFPVFRFFFGVSDGINSLQPSQANGGRIYFRADSIPHVREIYPKRTTLDRDEFNIRGAPRFVPSDRRRNSSHKRFYGLVQDCNPGKFQYTAPTANSQLDVCHVWKDAVRRRFMGSTTVFLGKC